MTAPPSDPDPRVLHLRRARRSGSSPRVAATAAPHSRSTRSYRPVWPVCHGTVTGRRPSFTVQEGRLQVVVGRDTRVLLAGETVTVPPTVTHGFSNPFDEPARIRMRETPAGPLEEQLRALAGSGRIPPIGVLATINVRHGLSFAVHGVPDPVQEPVWRLLARVHRVRLRLSSPARR